MRYRCPDCKEESLEVEWKLSVVEGSLSGTQVKLPVKEMPWLVCKTEGCGFKEMGELVT